MATTPKAQYTLKLFPLCFTRHKRDCIFCRLRPQTVFMCFDKSSAEILVGYVNIACVKIHRVLP